MCDNLANNYSAKSLIYKNHHIELSEINAEKQINLIGNINNEHMENVIAEFFAFKNNIDFNFIDFLTFCFGFNKKKENRKICSKNMQITFIINSTFSITWKTLDNYNYSKSYV